MTAGVPAVRLPLIQQYLREQRELTAVERFSKHHDSHAGGDAEARYRDLIPLTDPEPGQQYAFSVDLDRCSGCKACVTACHSLNGLDESETWRFVGLMHGGTAEQPVQRTVTSACHHCLDPACLNGCPVNAYEKDPHTGIVKHLDDQCIGCKYCTLTCPYEVPQYNREKGIVRKCDMCSERLAVGEAPACVQACPNEAISIEIVNCSDVLENAQTDAFLPAAPSSGITVPTTSYKTEQPLPRNMLPADFYAVHPAEDHPPLVVMLVLTQLSVGAFAAEALTASLSGGVTHGMSRFLHAVFSLGVGLLALSASLFHLGRPQYAFRAVLGVRHSWLSREILGFGVFAKLAVAYAVWLGIGMLRPELLPANAPRIERWLGPSVASVGLLAVFCSAMLYHATKRQLWNLSRSGPLFFLTSAVLGLASTIAIATAGAFTFGGQDSSTASVAVLCQALVLCSVVKLGFELSLLAHLHEKRQSELKRTALLLVGELAPWFKARFAFGLIGGVLAPYALLSSLADGFGVPALACALFSLLSTLAGELCERRLYFASVCTPRMPGGLR